VAVNNLTFRAVELVICIDLDHLWMLKLKQTTTGISDFDFEHTINMESYTFAGSSTRRYRIVDGQKFQINKMQASLRHLSSN
jgi:hypothetical protein